MLKQLQLSLLKSELHKSKDSIIISEIKQCNTEWIHGKNAIDLVENSHLGGWEHRMASFSEESGCGSKNRNVVRQHKPGKMNEVTGSKQRNRRGDNGKWVPATPCARQKYQALVHLIFSTAYEVDIISLILQEKKQKQKKETVAEVGFYNLRLFAKAMCITICLMSPLFITVLGIAPAPITVFYFDIKIQQYVADWLYPEIHQN